MTSTNTGGRQPLAAQCFVRRRGINSHGMVEFDFAIGDPDLYVEMILPVAAFAEFCEVNRVRVLSEPEGAAIDADREKWRLGDHTEEGPDGVSR